MYLSTGITEEEAREKELSLREREVRAAERAAKSSFWDEAVGTAGAIVVTWLLSQWLGIKK